MIVLLTNDDGVNAEGLAELRNAFLADCSCEVYVAAPDRERSASGHAITMHQPLRVEEVRIEGIGAKAIWSISGTPADCTKLAVKGLLPVKPDVVVSGINRGPNYGTDVFYSGTVSAAIEASMLGIPAIAISISGFEGLDYSGAARFAVQIAKSVVMHGLPRDTILNVNVPALPESDISGVTVTRLGVSRYNDHFEKRVDPRGKAYYWLTGEVQVFDESPDTDIGAIRTNMISVTPLHLDLTHHDLVSNIKTWELRHNPGGTDAKCQNKPD